MAILDGKSFDFLSQAYPEWVEYIRSQNKVYKIIKRYQAKFKKRFNISDSFLKNDKSVATKKAKKKHMPSSNKVFEKNNR